MTKQELTRTDTLRDSKPVWLDSPRISVRTRSSPSISHFDVIIVGAGISAALVAHSLTRPGRSVLLVDRRGPVKGSSIASTAMIQHEIDMPLHKLQKMIGKGKAVRAWQRSCRAVLQLEEIVRSLDISCSMRRKKALYLAGDEYGARALRREVKEREDAGIAAAYLSEADLAARYDLNRGGAILSDISASANPGQLTAGLLRNVASRGAEIVSGVTITDLKCFASDVVLATSEGRLLSASNVVFCTGYEFLKSLESKKHQIISTWALASRKGLTLPSWLKNHILWEASEPYLYLRTDNDGRIIAGGEDENDPDAFESETKLKAKTDTIRVKLSELLGLDIGAPEYRWSAAFGTTTTGLPMIGAVPGMSNVYAVMGFGGNGITFSQIAAELVSAEINGTQDPDAELFAFS